MARTWRRPWRVWRWRSPETHLRIDCPHQETSEETQRFDLVLPLYFLVLSHFLVRTSFPHFFPGGVESRRGENENEGEGRHAHDLKTLQAVLRLPQLVRSPQNIPGR